MSAPPSGYPAAAPSGISSAYELGILSMMAGIAPPEPDELADDPRDWLRTILPDYFQSAFGPPHDEFWRWVWAIVASERTSPLVSIWPRGFGKSTSAEASCVAVGARQTRRYVLYVCGTQSRADEHVENIAAMLESTALETHYPDLANRRLNKYGYSRGWTQSRLRCASGFAIDAIGLDGAARGIKFDMDRPDYIILDDIDQESDTPEATERKIRRITRAILPAGSDDVAVLAIQNLILPDGVFARLAPGAGEPATFLSDREVSGPYPAVAGMEYATDDATGRVRITAGTPTWAGMDIQACEDEIATIGLLAFLVECQQEVAQRGTNLMDRAWWLGSRNRYDVADQALLNRVARRVIAWDTAEETHDRAAYSAAVVIDLIQSLGRKHVYYALIRDVMRGRWEMPALVSEIVAHAERWRHIGQRQALTHVMVEYASSGRGAVQIVRGSAPAWLRGIVLPALARQSKDMRLRQAANLASRNRILLPLPSPAAPWLHEYEQELYSVPNSRYRDMTDATAHGIHVARELLALAPNAPALTLAGDNDAMAAD